MSEKLANPVSVRLVLIVTSILLIALQAGAIILGKQYLGAYATAVAEISAKSKDTQESLDSLSRAQAELEAQKKTVEKVKNIVAESKSYKYQNQVVTDLNAYAGQTGVVIKGFSFEDPSAKKDASATKNTSAIAGIQSTRVTMELESPLPYDVLVKFISLIESNVTRVQITELAVTVPDINDLPADQSWVSVPSLTVEVYLQK